ncbi:MAG: tetratricopeptide repeat protein, partial [Verrucomicrobia bacterium]|nr:tetratricopeptide repeat protein [Verrucomicrobiota bacterium]
ARKVPGTFRIFVLGESAALGTPAPAFGFARILEVMLRQQFPEKRFEVINTAMRGINSHAVLPIARECARHSPDLFLIYMGNNETVGLHSPEPRGFNITPYRRLILVSQWARATRLAQWVERTVLAVRKGAAKRPEQDMEYFREHGLLAAAPRRAPIYDNFRANLEDIAQATLASGVAVNLRDFPPLGSLHRPGLSAAELSKWEAAFAKGTNAEAHGQFAGAITNYLEAARVDDHFAEQYFRLARCYLANNQAAEARKHFGLSRDWDAIQFRTDSRQNEIVRAVAGGKKEAGLVLVDAEQAMAGDPACEHGLPGHRFFHEHVHLTFDGDYLLAKTFLSPVAKALGWPASPHPLPSRKECADALGFTEWDEIGVAAAPLRMTAKAPCLDQLDHQQRQTEAEAAIQNRILAFHQQGGFKQAVEVYRAALARQPEDWQMRMNFGNLLTDFSDHTNAVNEYAAAVRSMPVYPSLRLMLAQSLLHTGKRHEAIRQLEQALRIAPDSSVVKDGLAQLLGRKN